MHRSLCRSWAMDPRSDICKFARDLILYIMRRFYVGYHYVPPRDLREPGHGRSPFTPAVENAVTQLFLNKRLDLHNDYEAEINHEIMANEKHMDICIKIINNGPVMDSPFEPRDFLDMCVRLAVYSAQSFRYGSPNAPEIAVAFICRTIRRLIIKHCFDEHSWTMLQNYCVNEYPEPVEITG